jgi:hypothetical protein
VTMILVCVVIKMFYSLVPFISSETSWTLTNLTFNAVKNLYIEYTHILTFDIGPFRHVSLVTRRSSH